ncbi:hypothetical protein ONZ45_g6703 [Pleurotus djamor]|nr:hypothetical protein ONZ45_g6703 [Pleurotus djamor]
MSTDVEAQIQIDKEILELQARAEASIRRLKTKRNTYSLISQLPDEILCEVFVQAREAFYASEWPIAGVLPRGMNWLNVTSVCTHWHRVSDAPRFWSCLRIVWPNPSKIVASCDQHLRRSESAPLDVILWVDNEHLPRISQRLESHWHRVRKLSVSSATPLQSFVDSLKVVHASHLEYLSFITHSFNFVLPADIFHGDLTSLRTLKLFKGTVSSGLPPTPQLTHLIVHPYITSPLPLSVFLSMLQNAPALQLVEVSELRMDENVPWHVSLPLLKKFTLSSNEIELSQIFESIQYPTTAAIAYDCSDVAIGPGGALEIPGLMAVCSQLKTGTTSPITQLSLSLTPTSLILAIFTEYSASSPHISLSLASDDDFDALSVLLKLCSSLPLFTILGLTLEGFPASSLKNVSDFFQSFPAVEVLKLVGCPSEILAYMKWHHRRPPFPQLRTLLLEECLIDEAFHVGLTTLLTEHGEWGQPVERISVECCEVRDDFAYLEPLVPVVEWDGDRWDTDSDGSCDDESAADSSSEGDH